MVSQDADGAACWNLGGRPSDAYLQLLFNLAHRVPLSADQTEGRRIFFFFFY